MDYCTPQDFFERLDTEFHFALDVAATPKSAKCPAYYTPETNGLKSPWNAGGGRYFAIPHMDAKLGSGFARPMKKHSAGKRLYC